MNIVLCHGAFDVLHTGHIDHLRAARELGDRLIVSVSSDETVAKRKPGRPITSIGERVKMLRAISFVDEVWVCTSEDGSDAILLFCPTFFVKGRDYVPALLSEGEIEACRRVGARFEFTETEKRSSTELIERIRSAA